MASPSGPWMSRDDDIEIDEQPTEPTPAPPDLTPTVPSMAALPLPYADPFDDAATWPELVAIDVDQLIKNAIWRTHQRPCPICIYVRVCRGEIVEIGPQLPRLCEKHMQRLCAATPAERMVLHENIRRIYDWYHAPPEGEYSD